MTPHPDNRATALRCPVGVICVEGRIICYDHGKDGGLVARELGSDAAVEITPAMRRVILADLEHQKGKRLEASGRV